MSEIAPSVLQVAIRTDDGVIHTMPRPARHGEIINALWRLYHAPEGRSASDFGEQGFLLTDGTFANRRSAWTFAGAHDQIIPSSHRPNGVEGLLFTEDLW